MEKKSKKDELSPHDEMAELLEEQPNKEIDPKIPCEEVFGHSVKCGKCHTELKTIGEIRVTRGRVPSDFYQTLYRVICVECGNIVEKAIKVVETKGEVVGYERARDGALLFLRRAVEDGGKDDGCFVCGKIDPADKPDKFRHRIVTGLPAEIWRKEPEMRMLKGRQLCEFHARSARLAGFITVPIQKYLDREAQREAQLEELVEKFNQRNHSGTVVPFKKARKVASK